MKAFKKILCAVLCVLMVMSSMVFATAENEETTDEVTGFTQEDFLRVKGRKIVNQKGETVQLKGVNLGAWLVRENWLNPDCVDVEYKSKMTEEQQKNYWGTFYEDLTAEQKKVFDPYYGKKYDGEMIYDVLEERFGKEQAQELLDCVWVKFNDINKVRDAASADGFAGYGMFQNLIVGGQNAHGMDATNDLSYMCIEAAMHVPLPQPSISIRVWNGSPEPLLIKAAALTRLGTGLPAYYNDEIIIPSIMARGLTLEDARDYCIIGCVEPQKAGKTDGWHDAAFFNMCRPMELAFSNGYDKGKKIGPDTGDVANMKTFEEFYDAYKAQQSYMIKLLVNANNAIDMAHAVRCPLPFQSCMVEDCIGKAKSVQEGGAVYNFTGPQGFGIANNIGVQRATGKYLFFLNFTDFILSLLLTVFLIPMNFLKPIKWLDKLMRKLPITTTFLPKLYFLPFLLSFKKFNPSKF